VTGSHGSLDVEVGEFLGLVARTVHDLRESVVFLEEFPQRFCCPGIGRYVPDFFREFV